MCQVPVAGGEEMLAGDDTAVATRKARVIQVLNEAGIRPSSLTGLALLDVAVTLLTFHDTPRDAVYERVRQHITHAEDLRAALRCPPPLVGTH